MSFGQYKIPYAIKAIGKSKGDKIWVRWAPTRPEIWAAANAGGYIVERFILRKDGKLEDERTGAELVVPPNTLPKGTILTNLPLKPLPKLELERLASTEPLANPVAEAIYGTSKYTSKGFNPEMLVAKEHEKNNRFGMALYMSDLSQNIALASGLMLIDNKGLVLGKTYVYRIKLSETALLPANLPTGMPAIEDGIAIVDFLAETPMLPPAAPTAAFADQKAILKWEIATYKGVFGSYIVERSEDGKIFKALSKLPFTQMSSGEEASTHAIYTDSLPENRKKYHYRIIGINAFGEKSLPSLSVSGKGQDDLFGMTIISSIKVRENTIADLVWDFPSSHLQELSGFKVRYADRADGIFQEAHRGLLSTQDRNYTHKLPFLNTYYYVQAIDKEGNVRSQSFPFLAQKEDREPPARAENLVSKIDTITIKNVTSPFYGKKVGIVILRWNPGKDTDLLGYRVFRANANNNEGKNEGKGEEFTELTKTLLDRNIFIDTLTLEVLSKDLYYKIMVMDKYYNPSPYSEVLLVKRPDIVAPAAPLFTNYSIKPEGIFLQWQPSPSVDVAEYQLFRVNKDSVPLDFHSKEKLPIGQKIRSFSLKEHKKLVQIPQEGVMKGNEIGSYTDITPTMGYTYCYTLAVVDSAGNRGKARTGEIYFETGKRKAVANIKTSVDREKKHILITWTPADAGLQVEKCYIYRGSEKVPFSLYKTFTADTGTFTDTNLKINNTYTYGIQIIYTKRVRSELSAPIIVKY